MSTDVLSKRHPTGSRWSSETRKAVGAALLAGLDNTAIAQQLGVSRPSVARERAALNLPPKATRWGQRPHVVRGISRKQEQLRPLFAELHAAGVSDEKMAARAGCSLFMIKRWRAAAGVAANGNLLTPKRIRHPRKYRAKPKPPPFVPITPARDPLYAAAREAAAAVSPGLVDDLASDLIVAFLAGEISHPSPEAARRIARRYHERWHISLDATLEPDGRALINTIPQPDAESEFRLIELRHLAALMRSPPAAPCDRLEP